MLDLLAHPAFLPAMVIAVVVGGLLMLGLLTALDAIEERKATTVRNARTAHAPAPNAWGHAPHDMSARANLRSAPR